MMTVKKLKEILETLPDDMPVIIPIVNPDDPNGIDGFRYVKTAGVLCCEYEADKRVVCLNTSGYGLDIGGQLKHNNYRADTSILCEKVLY